MTLEEENELLKQQVKKLEATVLELTKQLNHYTGNAQANEMLQLTNRIMQLEHVIANMGRH